MHTMDKYGVSVGISPAQCWRQVAPTQLSNYGEVCVCAHMIVACALVCVQPIIRANGRRRRPCVPPTLSPTHILCTHRAAVQRLNRDNVMCSIDTRRVQGGSKVTY